jgi:hypothetical protein
MHQIECIALVSEIGPPSEALIRIEVTGHVRGTGLKGRVVPESQLARNRGARLYVTQHLSTVWLDK